MAVRRVVSGGQTGADRAALEAALALKVEIGGWVPMGRLAEDGPIPPHMTGLVETETEAPEERTRANVRDSDATLIVSHGPLAGGSALTLQTALEFHKPVLHVDLDRDSGEAAFAIVSSWLRRHRVESLNVAGPRASEDFRIYQDTFTLITALLTRA
jgi:hypothetical protein